MIYPTLKATVRKGKIQLLDPVDLPENAVLLVTVMEDEAMEVLPLGEHLVAGLQDRLVGRATLVETPEELTYHLDTLFREP